MQFHQRQGRTSVALHLRDQDFLYTLRHDGHQFSGSFPYHGWPFEGEAVRDRFAWLCWAGWISTAVGLLVGGWSHVEDEHAGSAIPWLLASVGLHAACAWTTRRFSRFVVGTAPLLLLCDAQHDTIAAELARRRTLQLRGYLQELQPRPRPKGHQRRLDWLRASGVITEAEYEQAIDPVPPGPLPNAQRA